MDDLLKCGHEIKAINYDNGLRKYMDYNDLLNLKVYDGVMFPPPVQTLTIDFGDTELEIVGQATWRTKAKEEYDNPEA